MPTDNPTQQVDTFVNILAQIHDSNRILASNQHAALEADQALRRDRAEAEKVRAETAKLKADTTAYWQEKAGEIEKLTALAAQMRQSADDEYHRRVAEAENAGKAVHDAWLAKAQSVEVDHSAKHALLQEINAEVTKGQAILDGVKAEARALRERLNL